MLHPGKATPVVAVAADTATGDHTMADSEAAIAAEARFNKEG